MALQAQEERPTPPLRAGTSIERQQAAIRRQTRHAPCPSGDACWFWSAWVLQNAAAAVSTPPPVALEWDSPEHDVEPERPEHPASRPQALNQAPSCEAMDKEDVRELVEQAAGQEGLEPRVIMAVIERESGFRPCATSPKGARGLMQLMPATASDLGVENVFDARQSINGGARFLKQMLDRYQGNLGLALGAYNAGPARVDKARGIPKIPETEDYVRAILTKLGQPD